jgi:hypothetical protein
MSVHASEGSGTDDSIDDHTSAQNSELNTLYLMYTTFT